MSHHWARKIRQLGHAVVLLSPHLVRPYVRRNKTDRTDAVALVEAYRHRQIRPVPVKTPEQQLLTSLHRLRAGWVRQRTARRNTLRACSASRASSSPSVPSTCCPRWPHSSRMRTTIWPWRCEGCWPRSAQRCARSNDASTWSKPSSPPWPGSCPPCNACSRSRASGSSSPPHSWCARRAQSGRRVRLPRPAPRLGPRPARPRPSQQGGRGLGQQDGPYRLGRLRA